MKIGDVLSPSWNNEACSYCKKNHNRGVVLNLCPVLYEDKCFVESINLLIQKQRKFMIITSCVFDFIRKEYPELRLINNIGTTEVFIPHFQKTFFIQKDWTESYILKY